MRERKDYFNIIAILSINITNACGTFENAALQTIIEAWPTLSSSTVRLLVTLPGLVSMVVMSGVGMIVGKKLKFRTCVISGLFLALFGGIVPFLIHDYWYLILGCRILIGLGVGLLSVRSSILMLSVPKENLAKYIGWGAALGSVTSALISILVGVLAKINWYYPFLVNAVVFITTICVLLFLKEPEMKNTYSNQINEQKNIPTIMYIYIIIQFVITVTLYPLLSGLSTYLDEIHLGDASMAGWMLSLYTGAGIISSLYLQKIQSLFKDRLLPFLLSLCALGLGLVLFSHQVFLIALGIFLSGMGFITYVSSVQIYTGKFCESSVVVKVSPLLFAMTQLGVFLSSYYIEFTNKFTLFSVPMKNTFFVGLLVYVVLAIFLYVFRKKFYPQ